MATMGIASPHPLSLDFYQGSVRLRTRVPHTAAWAMPAVGRCMCRSRMPAC